MRQFLLLRVVGLSVLLLGAWGCGRIGFESRVQEGGSPNGMDGGMDARSGSGFLDAADAGSRSDGTNGGAGDASGRQDGSAVRDASSMADGSSMDASSVTDATYARDASDASTADADSGCTVASDTCWDIWAVQTKTDFERVANHIFEKEVSDGEKVYGLFDGSTDTVAPQDTISCPPYYRNVDKPEGWEIWRTAMDADTYRIRVFGVSDADCDRGQPVAAGEIQIDTDAWRITSVASCNITEDTLDSNDTLIDTWCTVDMSAGNVTWQSGSGCGGCCACPDGANVDIDFTVERR